MSLEVQILLLYCIIVNAVIGVMFNEYYFMIWLFWLCVTAIQLIGFIFISICWMVWDYTNQIN